MAPRDSPILPDAVYSRLDILAFNKLPTKTAIQENVIWLPKSVDYSTKGLDLQKVQLVILLYPPIAIPMDMEDVLYISTPHPEKDE